jgi:ParB family transcriptional regulator, chromosome partitioning protein
MISMASKPKIDGLKILKLDQLVLGDSQARKKGVEKNIGDLMASIEAVGLIQPIVVAPKEDSDLFEVIAGQRRLLAHTRLGKETIMAVAFDQPVGELEAMLISLSENAVRQEMENPDYIDACGYLYDRYGTMTAVADETGIPYRLVSKYVKIDRLSEPVKDAVRAKDITMDAAIRGTQAAEAMAGGEGLADPQEVLAFARHMSSVSGVQQKKIVEVATAEPDKGFNEVLDAAEQNREIQVIAALSTSVHSSLQEYADDAETLQERAAAMLIESGLDSAGYSTS